MAKNKSWLYQLQEITLISLLIVLHTSCEFGQGHLTAILDVERLACEASMTANAQLIILWIVATESHVSVQ